MIKVIIITENTNLLIFLKIITSLNELLEDSMTSLQELVLSGDVETTNFQVYEIYILLILQIHREKDRNPGFKLIEQNSLLQYAILTGFSM